MGCERKCRQQVSWWWWPWPPWPPSPEPGNSNCAEICDSDLDQASSDLEYTRNVLGAWVAKVRAGVAAVPRIRPPSASTNDKGREMVDKIHEIRSYVEQLYPLYVPTFSPSVVEVDVDWLMNRLVKLPNFSTSRWLPLDGKYYTMSLDDFKRAAAWDRTNAHKYFSDRFDCDKYAMYFKSRMAWFFGVNAVAVVIDYGVGHAYNIVFPTDSNPMIYEPQTDQFIEIGERDETIYGLKNYYILV